MERSLPFIEFSSIIWCTPYERYPLDLLVPFTLATRRSPIHDSWIVSLNLPWYLNWALAFSKHFQSSLCLGIALMPSTNRYTSKVRFKLILSLDDKRVAAKCTAAWHDHDRPKDSTQYSNFENRNSTLPHSFNHHTITVTQQGYVIPWVYYEVNLPSAKSKLPGRVTVRRWILGRWRYWKSQGGAWLHLQPRIRPISHKKLVSEVKGLYAGLVMVEAKCCAENEKWSTSNERQSRTAHGRGNPKGIHVTNDQWQSVLALHRNLLHEHHDFFLTSQHPSASSALSRLVIWPC